MPMATSNQKWSHSCPESHILAWWFTKRQVGMPDECLLLRVFGNCWASIHASRALARSPLTLAAVIRRPYSHRMPLSRANPDLHLPVACERRGPMAHQEVLLRLQGRRIQGLLQVIPDQQAA